MAANILELLRQIQRDLSDQKEYMRNLHVINRNLNDNFNFMNVKISDLDKKIDKHHIIIENIEQHVKNNNMVLFGNDEAQINLDVKTESYKIDLEGKEKDLVEKTEKNMEVIETDQLQTSEQETKNTEDDNEKDDWLVTAKNDNKCVEEFVTNVMEEMSKSIKDFMATTKLSIKGAATKEPVPTTNSITDQINNINESLKIISDIYQSDMKEMKELMKDFTATTKTSNAESTGLDTVPTINCILDQINSLNDELKNVSNLYQSDMKEMKELTIDHIAAMKMLTEKASSTDKKQMDNSTLPDNISADQINKLCIELKQIYDTYMSEIQAKKELMNDIIASVNKIDKVAASRPRKQVAVQITPTYLNPEQITKLNEELKRITEMYVLTDVFPIIEVQSGVCDHPVMKQLSKGVFYKHRSDTTKYILCELSPTNFKRSEVLDVVTEYPDLSVTKVIQAIGTKRALWGKWCELYNFGIVYQKIGNEYLPLK